MKEKLKEEIAGHLERRKNIFFYRKGRVALYAILKAMGIGKGDEVIIQAFTCVVVASAVKYLGAKPVYVDIRPDTYTMDIMQLEQKINANTRAIICQNTFGLSAQLELIIRLAKENDIFTIEDCAHGFGGSYHGRPNGISCDASFFSMQWNKPFSSGLGGFALVNNPVLLARMEELEKEKIQPGRFDGVNLKILYFAHRHFLKDFTYWPLLKVYRWLSRHNMVIGSSEGGELTSTVMPENYFMDYSDVQAGEGCRNLRQIMRVQVTRMVNAGIYTRFLEEHNKTAVGKILFPDHSFLKYPLLVNDRPEFFRRAEHNRIRLGDWFISPLHPVTSNLEAWDFNPARYPVAARIASQIVNLPTDTKDYRKVLAFLEKNLELIL